jgi:hypothetical protein
MHSEKIGAVVRCVTPPNGRTLSPPIEQINLLHCLSVMNIVIGFSKTWVARPLDLPVEGPDMVYYSSNQSLSELFICKKEHSFLFLWMALAVGVLLNFLPHHPLRIWLLFWSD